MNASHGDPVWEQLYSSNRHVLRYPYDCIVVFVNRYAPRDRERSAVRILEVGCGTGNNLWFAAREGFRVWGLDGSASAVRYAQDRFAADGLPGEFVVGDFARLPYEDGFFDLVIDRGALVCTGMSVAAQAVREIRRVIRGGGRFFFNPFSKRHASFAGSDAGPDGTRVNIRGGNLIGVGSIGLYDRADVDRCIGTGWKPLAFEHVEIVDHVKPDAPMHAEWRITLEAT